MTFSEYAGKQLKKYRINTLKEKNIKKIIGIFSIAQNTYYRQEQAITDWEFLFRFLSHYKIDLNEFFEISKYFQQDIK